MICGFFLFFKQKTAYEMRISDWSSDVCSSDLLPVALSEAALAQYFTFRYVPEPDSILEPIRKLEPGMILQVFPDGRMRRQRYFSFTKIGRASCRERVCQYV